MLTSCPLIQRTGSACLEAKRGRARAVRPSGAGSAGLHWLTRTSELMSAHAGGSTRVLVISLVLDMVFCGNLDRWQPRGVGNDIVAGWSRARLRGDSTGLLGQLALPRRFSQYKWVVRPPPLKQGRFSDRAASAGESP